MDFGSVPYYTVFAYVDVASDAQRADHRASINIHVVPDVHLLIR